MFASVAIVPIKKASKEGFLRDRFFPILILQKIEGAQCLIIRRKKLLFVLRFLKNYIGYQYNLLSCISGVDYLRSTYRFGVVYELLSLTFNNRLRIKIYLDEQFYVPSITFLYKNANWWEREIWDMFGILFSGHFDLRRILTDYSFEGHPLRKDFPLSGFYEIFFYQSNFYYKELQLDQEHRTHSFF
jgi:NADH/F420H2 dehydrogenase subunit C